MPLYRLVVIGGRFAFFKRDGIGGAGGQTVAQPIALILPQQNRFAVFYADGAFVAGLGTQTAAVAFFLVNFYDFTDHITDSSIIMKLCLNLQP